ncbi:GntR family transcriptional regulator [Streptomyces winkii]|uniref:GntR family transcriptional regulator n=1 Tax=Streptomyces winkii TaxID=3051178 RepID=UPI0028D7417C|nr:GntR family transcriptional regulator [Streptomyces sp. DSM 40971]
MTSPGARPAPATAPATGNATGTAIARAGAPGRARTAYRGLADDLRAALLSHRYPEGARLPTEAELVRTYRVSRQTVRRAFQDLVAEGLVHRVPGRGTFAAPRGSRYVRQFGSVDDLMSLSVDTTMRLSSPLRRQVDVDAAGRLRLESDVVHTAAFLRFHDDVPFCHTAVWLPPRVGEALRSVPELAEEGAVGTVTVLGLLDERLPAPVTDAEQSITVAAAPERVAAELRCEPRHPVLRIDRLYATASGERVELAVSHFLPEQYSYRVRLRRGPL